jgi:hypothetical protein
MDVLMDGHLHAVLFDLVDLMTRPPLHLAGRFLYAREEVGIHVPDLLVEPKAVEVARLRQDCARLLARDGTNPNSPPVRTYCGGEGKRQERILIVLL